MTKSKDTAFLERLLLKFVTEPDPLLSMLQWLTDQLVEAEVYWTRDLGQHP